MMTHRRVATRHHANARGLCSVGMRHGFTLVEMLVSVALVVIMMSMFATVFQLAAGSMGTQRGIAENDQRARSATIVIRNDLENRSFKKVLPFTNVDPATITDGALRRGYLYISENDRFDDTDDVLQFTVELPGTTGDFYIGKATDLSTLSSTTNFLNSNEPDRDDGNPITDSSSESVAAEITYFLRSGRLYRRVLLIRDPLSSSANVQPDDVNGYNYFDPTNDGSGSPAKPAAYTGNFWNDFDFSAHIDDNSGTYQGALLHGKVDLDNTTLGQIFTGAPAIGNPPNRFGHNHSNGRPREYVNGTFIGRFTHQETSYGRFQYPHAIGTMGNPMSIAELRVGTNDAATDGKDSEGVVIWYGPDGNPGVPGTDDDEILNGSRRAEDLLLTNVHSFDVKVWDDGTGSFEDLGHANTSGIFRLNGTAHTNTGYGPAGAATPRVFDTWHPNPDGDTNYANDAAPPFTLSNRLRAIQISIRYLDVSSNQMRQLTLQVSLMNDT